MNRTLWRILMCCALAAGLAVAGGGQTVQAQGTASLPDFTSIVQKNAPAVVQVVADYNGTPSNAMSNSQMPQGVDPNSPQWQILQQLFGMPMMPSPQEQAHISLGSGFIISSDGYILTNNHVVANADKVTVRLQDRRTLVAKVVGTDPIFDIALLKVKASTPLPTVHIGDSSTLQPGQWVLAIGSPFGFDYTVTQGIVSAVGRSLGGQDQSDTAFIQTDVPINRGNSGGPLFNLQGQVVGINSQIYSNTGDYVGVSFSIPINLAMNVVHQLETKGFVTRGQLGVYVRPVTEDVVNAFHLDSDSGALVVKVVPDSSAEKAGIQPGDVIVGYNGHTIEQGGDLPPLVAMTAPGTKVPVQVMRNGKKLTLMATIGTMKNDGGVESGGIGPTAKSGASALGLAVRPMDSSTREQLGLKPGQGVVVSDITGPVAAQAGLQEGDVILMVNQRKIGSVEAFHAATAQVKPGDTVLLLVQRGSQTNFVSLSVPSGKTGG